MRTFKKYLNLIKASLDGEERDYTEGNIRTAIVLLSIPMILELSLESVFAVVDMFFVGRLGENAIAVVGYTESVITLIYSVAIGLSTAATAVIARRVGEKRPEEASRSAMQALMISGVVTVILSITGVVLAPEILGFMGATPEVISQGQGFTAIMFGSSGVIVFLFLINGIFRGAGNAALAMRSLWIASIINIILDPVMIYGIGHWNGLGLEGAAIATCIGRGTGVGYQLFHMIKGSGIIKVKASDFVPDRKIILSMISLAWPATFQFIIASGSWIVLTKLVAETGGTSASAGYQIAIRNVVFFILPAWGLSNAAATLTGQNLGAKKIERVFQSVKLAALYNAVFMFFVTMIFLIFPAQIISVFSSEPEVTGFGARALRIIGGGFIFYGIGMVMIQSLNGAGDTRTPTWINFFGFWLIQIPLAYFLTTVAGIGIDGAFIAVPVAESLIAAAAWYYFRLGKWKDIKV
ncbi:MAG: MATE family efflux transporter [Saprospiraceae bacterium]|nr:MATE family efflux transporter [Saprospiraceae bacterium]